MNEPTRPSAIGYVLWEATDPATRKPNPSPQGMAIFAGKFLNHLLKMKLVTHYHGYRITQGGRDAILAQNVEQKQESIDFPSLEVLTKK